tara:strand:+ start:1771 stop:2295 length:525 start_codon:yes stop_codon:yes gene_type:complete
MARVIIPKIWVPLDKPFIYLAGPIRGAPNWQDEAIVKLVNMDPNVTIVSPRRDVRPAIEPYIAQGTEDAFPRQRAWERQYMDMAMIRNQGVIMFWLPEEKDHRCEKSYALITSFELGYVLASHTYKRPIKFCVGTDGKYPEFKVIDFDLEVDAPRVPIHNTLETTCQQALSLMK